MRSGPANAWVAILQSSHPSLGAIRDLAQAEVSGLAYQVQRGFLTARGAAKSLGVSERTWFRLVALLA